MEELLEHLLIKCSVAEQMELGETCLISCKELLPLLLEFSDVRNKYKRLEKLIQGVKFD